MLKQTKTVLGENWLDDEPENYENKYGAINKQGLFNTQKKPIGKGAKRLKIIPKQQKEWSID